MERIDSQFCSARITLSLAVENGNSLEDTLKISNEHQAFRWVSLNQALELDLMPNLQDVLKTIQNRTRAQVESVLAT